MRRSTNRQARAGRGVTLIELLVVLALMAILAAIGYPSYAGAVRQAKRSEGKRALMQLMQQEERYYSQHNSYIGFSSASLDADEKRFKWYSGDSAAASAYEISAAACTKDGSLSACVRLVARPGTGKVDAGFKDEECGKLSLDSTGAKGADGAAGGACWN